MQNSDMVGVGMDLGVYVLAKLQREGVVMTPEALQALGEYSAKSIEEATGVPAEDLALTVQPIIDKMLEKLK